MAPAVGALQALGGVRPSTLARAFPVAAAALGDARDRARDVLADQQARPPLAPAIAVAAPPPVQPDAVPRHLHRHAPIEHAASAGQKPEAPRAPDRVSAGPRPLVPLTGASDPAAADARHQATHDTLALHLQHADRAAQRDIGIERIPAPAVEGDRRPPAALGGPAPAPAPAPAPRSGPTGGDPEMEAMLAPRVAAKINAAAASAQAVVAHSEAYAATFEAQRQAAARHEAAEQARVRTAATQRGEALRGQWHHANARLHREHSARIAQKHEQMKATVQASVLHTEREADHKLTEAETGGQRELAAARSRADAIRAAAHAQDHAQDHPADAGQGEADAKKVLDEAQQLVADMLAAAKQHNLARVEELRQQVARLLTDHAAEMQTFIEATLAAFPQIGKFYQQQIDELMRLVQTDSSAIAAARTGRNRELFDAWTDRLTHDLGLMKRYFGEVETIAQYGGDIDQLRAAFGITLNGDKWKQKGKNYEETALLAAISTEHAFRRSATEGQMDNLDFGKGFQAVFGQMEMDYNPTQPYLYTVKQGPDGLWYTYNADGSVRQKPGKGFATEADANKHKGAYGAETKGAHQIEFYDAAFKAGDADPKNLLFNVIHEFGHAFNVNARGRGYAALGSETIEAMVDGKNTKIAGKGVPRQLDEKYGMRPYPYQEDVADKPGEEFADMFLNWVEDSFVDNDAGRARYAWMNQHMWGDTTLRGVEGEKLWGWADTAIDRNSGASKWVDDTTSSKDGHYRVRAGDTLQGIADKLKIKDPSIIQKANNMGDSTDVSAYPVLIIPGVSDQQISKLLNGG